MLRSRILLPIALAALALGLIPAAHATERSEVPAVYRWDVTALFPTEDAWLKARTEVEKGIPALEAYKGRLGESPATFFEALALRSQMSLSLSHLGVYASMLADEDTRDAHHLEMNESVDRLGVQMSAASAFYRPEMLALGADKIHAFLAAEPRLAPWKPVLEDLLRYGPHTLSAGEEQVAAQAGRLAGTGYSLRSVFNNAELPWPTIKLSDGKSVRLDDAAYTQYRQSANRADRDSVFRAFFGAHRQFQATYGTALDAGVQTHIFDRDVHHYKSCLESALFGDNIPVSVYHQLVKDVNDNLPTLHRYLKLRQRMMGLPDLRYEDLYAPIVKEVDMTYTPEQAQALVLEAVAPLGKAYVDTLGYGFRHGWVDWMPTTGKRSGAYSTGAYGVHPYQLQNFTGMFDEVSTVAHESGHSMHTFLADQRQPYQTHDYATFVAEVASTLNENLLHHTILDRTKDTPTRIFLLGNHLEGLRQTLFRQTMFAEYELAIHEKAEKGEVLSGENLSRTYLDIVRKYYGHDAGVCKVDELYGIEWSYIPHFFYDFYVYQYATSIVASTALANGIRDDLAHKRLTKRDAYLNMLASGSSKYPIDLLREAGVDMTTSAPFQAAMREMNATMDEMEKLLAAPKGKQR